MTQDQLIPKRVFEQFARINAIPRPSKREEKMITFLEEWGKNHNLETHIDAIGNVIIRKKATKGYEDRKTLILQSHMDMVCDKLVDVEFDFDRDAIQTYIDGEWLTAKGTTLGADDGIGVAIELALLEDESVEHGPLECVFTRDEETQLTGATGMQAGFMTGDMLINLDSEDEGQVFVSCAGGKSTMATFHFEREDAPKDSFFLTGKLKGLKGGHSGDDIEKKRANAIKILGRFLYELMQETNVLLCRFDSGRMHNAIPRDGSFTIAIPQDYKEKAVAQWNIFQNEVKEEYHVSDTEMVFDFESSQSQKVLPCKISQAIIRSFQAIDNGIYAMCQDEDLAWMVETSSNIASVKTTEKSVEVVASQRSNVMSALRNQCNTIKATFELAGAEVEQNDGYPAWKMNPHSRLTAIVKQTYCELYGKEPQVKGIHAGLECGLFSLRYPNIDMVSFGPTLRNVHTPDEKLYIPSVKKIWDLLIAILKEIPKKEDKE